jgi:DNA (cytosine-5)-methyltransferase 1
MENFAAGKARGPRLLDLFCGQFGAGKGYQDAGFQVTGVDIRPILRGRQPQGVEFVHGDAMELLRSGWVKDGGFDVIHASPPCRAYTKARGSAKGRYQHPDLVAEVRAELEKLGVPYVIENVPGAPLLPEATVLLCGSMFGMRIYRHRLFEIGRVSAGVRDAIALGAIRHPEHAASVAKMGRPAKPGEFVSLVGNFSGLELAREVMGMPWANQDGIRQAIPPAFTRFIGSKLIRDF